MLISANDLHRQKETRRGCRCLRPIDSRPNTPGPTSWELLFRLEARFSHPLEIQAHANCARLEICYFTSGKVVGPRLSGRLLPGGGDWAVYRSPDSFDIDARAVLHLEDGSLIYLRYAGIWRAQPGVLKKVFAPGGFQYFLPAEHYVRVVARFQTASCRYSWLNESLALGIGSLSSEESIGYNFYDIK